MTTLTRAEQYTFNGLKEFTARTVLAMPEKERAAWEKLENTERAAIAACVFFFARVSSGVETRGRYRAYESRKFERTKCKKLTTS